MAATLKDLAQRWADTNAELKRQAGVAEAARLEAEKQRLALVEVEQALASHVGRTIPELGVALGAGVVVLIGHKEAGPGERQKANVRLLRMGAQ